MLTIVPLIAYLGFVLVLGNLQPALDWRQVALRAAVAWGSALTAITEVLSLLHAVQAVWLAVAWALICLAIVAVVALRARRKQPTRLPTWHWRLGWAEKVLLIGILVVVVITGVVAWVAPPQTWDSLNYHMSRVAHWAQDRSVEPFATGIEVQNSRTPLAEFAVLNVYVLSQGDRLVNFVQWSAMVLSLLGVTLIARHLGASPIGEWLAAAFAVSLPMGIIQASSTTTDYVVAFWLVCVALEWMSLSRASVGKDGLLFASLAAGLGALTKPTAAAFMLPFALMIAVIAVRNWGIWTTARWALGALALVLAINAGHLTRTYETYGTLIDPEQYGVHANQVRDPRGLLSNILRNIGIQLGTPSPYVNKGIYQSILTVHDWIGLDINDPRTTSAGEFAIRRPQTNEDLAGNPLHAIALLIIVPLVTFERRKYGWLTVAYAVGLVAAFLLFSFVFKWQIFGVRYHLPLFVLGAPLFGLVLGRLTRQVVPVGLGVILLLASLPWLLQIDSRPLIPGPRSTVGGILTTPREELYFANALHLEAPIEGLASRIRATGCRKVGLSLSGNGIEYPWWVLMGAPSDDLNIAWIVGGTASARYADPSFEPCAVICENCSPGWRSPNGLPLAEQRGGFSLFLGAR